ncbi:hypothetical protein FPQ18DRAFT_104164 [Pyronema domesticum]|uniref:Prion-inhibition and propagation HeLo domain-containing protein n=1 Tax=Pyronema omphalodes (strain CBS 100304) TaxID=1076935 RepID=U4LED3_PYROM|nr:hypothetical protein FPQ18DRAFT_104164 [Pyronema domesticum]CCX30228.1 Similar to hypothetical protein AOL_s00215g655 [Arthrobotrys oligospora ATCC 24927]; acc. no. EGX43199 [Pyronema omphalodes CBS 100304]
MSGLEIAGVVLAGPAVVGQLVQNTLNGYRIFSDARLSGQGIRNCQRDLGVQRERLEDWVQQIADMGGDLSKVTTQSRYKLILETLALIVGIFAQVDQLEKKYGILCVNPGGGIVRPLSSAQSIAGTDGEKRRMRDRIKNKFQKWFTESDSTDAALIHKTVENKSPLQLKNATLSSVDVTTITVRELSLPTRSMELDASVPGLASTLQQMETTAKLYQNTLSAYQQYE